MSPIDLNAVMYVVIGVATAGLSGLAWRQRPKPGAETLGILMGSVAVWNLALLWALVAGSFQSAFIAGNFIVIAAAVTTIAFLAFTLEYTGREELLIAPYVYLLGIEPVAVAIAAFTNSIHGEFWIVSRAAGYSIEGGPLLYAHIAFTYVILAIGTVLIAFRLYRARGIHRRQAWAILVAVLAPWIGNIVYVVFIEIQLLQTSGFVVTGVVVYWAITKYQLVDLTPVARATIMDALEVGVIVLDQDDRVTDLNQFAGSLLALQKPQSHIGAPVETVLADVPELAELVDDAETFDTIVSPTIEDEDSIMSVKASSLSDALDRSVGRLLLLEDVTRQERRRAEIQAQNERLSEFATMVSHDLRNPLDVASGHVELMRSSREPAEDREGVYLDEDRLDETVDALGRIETIVDDVLTLAREGRNVTDPEAISLRSAARTAWEHVETENARLVVGTDAKIVADRDHLERLFENLFRNAVEHAGPDVTVSIGVMQDEDGPRGFYVADDGPGIPEVNREVVFESGFSGVEDGTGFGLAIVAQLADAHDWTIRATESDDGGARFEITGVEFGTIS